MLNDLFSPETLSEAWRIIESEFLSAIWETVYVTVLATLFSVIIGLPLGVLLVAGEKNGVLPLPSWFRLWRAKALSRPSFYPVR